jgi:hypothetical protein
MRRVKNFIEQERRETEARIANRGRNPSRGAPSLSFLEGRLEALNLLSHYIDRLEEKDIMRNGSASAFSPQG